MLLPTLDRYSRKTISPGALAVVIDVAAADPARPLSRTDVDWKEVYEALLRNGLIGLAQYFLTTNPAASAFPPAFRDEIKKAFLLHSLRMAVINRHIRQVLDMLNQSGIDYLLVKGPSVARSLYPSPNARVYNDLDLIIHERDWEAFGKRMLAQGYTILSGEHTPPPKVIPAESDHETEYINAEGSFRVEAHYDDILRTGFVARDVEGFWQRSIWMELDGVPYRTLSLEDQLIYLCAHAHHHNYARLNWFSDIALLLRKKAHQIHWQQLIATIKKEEAQVPVYFGLYFLEKLFGDCAPAFFMQAIRPNAFRIWLHNRLLPPQKVLAFEPLQTVVFSFYFYPLYHRLLPDLLVMGRWRDKLKFMQRLLLPPRAWLRYYYKLKQDAWIDYYYVVHPLLVAKTYLQETFALLFRLQKPQEQTAKDTP